MKRGLVFSLCALAVAISASSAMAQATIMASLNLRYTDPADPSEGGTWQLVAKTDDDDGIAALVVYLQNAGNAAGTTMAGNIGALTQVGDPPGPALLDRTGGVLEVVYGQDLTAAGTVLDVGQSNFGGAIANDALKNPAWNGAALIASGAFSGTRPSFVSFGGHDADGNTLPDTVNGTTPAPDANVTTIVRGDSVTLEGAGKGLLPGDANRDGVVNGSDFALLGAAWQQAGGWDNGDFNDSGTVDGSDFALLGGNWQDTQQPIAVSAIPEPSTALLALLGGICGIRTATRKGRR